MKDCIFCKIVQGEIPAEVVRETADFIVIKDIEPKASVHLLLIPKVHIPSLNEVAETHILLLGKMLHAAKQLAQEFDVAKSGYKLINNCGKDAGQEVAHLHIHLLGGKKMQDLV